MTVAKWPVPAYDNDECQDAVLWIDAKTKRPIRWCTRHGYNVGTCLVCGKKFHTRRQHARTCTGRCRQKLSREKV